MNWARRRTPLRHDKFHTNFLSTNTEKLGADGSIILKWILKDMVGWVD